VNREKAPVAAQHTAFSIAFPTKQGLRLILMRNSIKSRQDARDPYPRVPSEQCQLHGKFGRRRMTSILVEQWHG